MNNYYDFKDYYEEMINTPFNNLTPNSFNIKKQNNIESSLLFNPYQGFIRGNLFKNLYDPYISSEPFEIKPINKQAEMLTDIDALSFAMIDLNLYLDVYPNDSEKIELYNNYLNQKEELIKKYEKEYGPLTTMSKELGKAPWAWDDKPWPWK